MGLTVYGGGGKPEEEKTVTAGTSAIEVLPSSGKTMKKVKVNPTPSQSKSVTPNESAQTVSPDSGKLLSSVSVGAIHTEEKTVTAGTSVIEVNPSSGKVMKKVTVNPTPTESKSITAGTSDIAVSPTDGKHLSGVTIHPTPSQEKTVDPTGFRQIILPDSGKLLSKVTINGVDPSLVTWAGGTDEEIVKMVEAADRGEINLSDYWAVGDTRTVQLSAMSATGVEESHVAQEVDLVLMHAGGYTLNAAVASGRTKCSFIVGQKDSLATAGYMNFSNTNNGSWDGCARRTWCNSVYKNALPSTLLPIFKQFKTITAKIYYDSANQESVDYFALPAAKEMFGGSASSAGSDTGYSNLTEFNALFQFDYYKTTSNRVKKLGKTGSVSSWWERSPFYDASARFCGVNGSGAADNYSAGNAYGLAPFGCI